MSFSNVNETKHRAVHAQISSARHVLATSIIGTVRHILLQLIRVNKIKAIRMVMMVHITLKISLGIYHDSISVVFELLLNSIELC
jgi:hypothetical protein